MPDDDSGLRLQALLLADHANVREGMLSVLSAGITRVRMRGFPGQIAAFLVLMVYVPPDRVGLAHHCEIKIKYPNLAREIARVEATFSAQAETYPGEGLTLPVIVPIHNVPFTDPGEVDIQVSLNGQHAGDLSVWIVETTPE